MKRSLLFATFAMAVGGSAHALDPSVGAGLRKAIDDLKRKLARRETPVR